MLTRKSPSRARVVAGSAVVALVALGAGYAAWAAQPNPQVLMQAASEPLARVVQLAQADAPPTGAPHTVERVVINKDGQVATYEGDAIPPEVQAEIDAAQADGSAHKFVRIIRHGDAGAGDLPADADELIQKLAAEGGAHTLKIQCTKASADAEPICTTLEGDPAEAAEAIAKLKAEGFDTGSGAHAFILRREQR